MHNSTKMSRLQGGFTFLELLVVVAVIGFLSSVSIVALSSSQAKNRDAQRRLDAAAIVKAVTLYENDFGAPPAQLESALQTPAKRQSRLASAMTAAMQSARQSGTYMSLIRTASAQPTQAPNTCDLFYDMAESDTSFCYQICTGGSQCINGTCVAPPTGCHGGGGGGSLCGNGVCDASESYSSCYQDCPAQCDGDLICEVTLGENIGNCTSDCSVSAPAGGNGPVGGSVCGDGVCHVGETPSNCRTDCPDFSMCYVQGEWDLCCLFSGTYCAGGSESGGEQTSSRGGYYGVCSGDRCMQRYFLRAPSFQCSANADCVPGRADISAEGMKKKFVGSTANSWLSGLEPYIANFPKDPGHHTGDNSEIRNQYWASSHPDIVKNHRFCVYVSMERECNSNPYADITWTPTGQESSANTNCTNNWTILCSQ